jgi:hypothetical protein
VAGGVAWIWFRDWSPPGSGAQERVQATAAARALCDGCRIHVLGRPAPGRWLVRFSGSSAAACLSLALDPAASGGATQIRRERCPPGAGS